MLHSIVGVRTIFLSTPSVRRATPCYYDTITSRKISIHALRAEGDVDELWGSSKDED